MAEVKFSELPLASPLVGDEIVTGLKPSGSSSDDENVNFSIDDIAAYVFSQDSGGAASGDVVGPASATNNAISLYDGTTGKLLKDSAVTISTDGTLASNSDAKVSSEKAVKTYVDGKVAGLSWKQAVRAATTVAGTLASSFENGDSIDGVTLATGDRILVKNQSSGSENGIYTVNASGAPTRSTDADAGSELVNATMYVSEGTTLADTQWTCTTNAPITINSTSLAFAQLSTGAGTVTSVDASGGVQTASGSAITGTGTVRGAHVINAQTGTSYALIATDRGKHVTQSNASSSAYTIAQAGSTGFEDGYFTFLENIGVGALTLTPTTSTINGAATLVLDSGMSAIIFSDGTNYRAIVIERAGLVVNAQTGTSYTFLSGDRGKLVTQTNASAIADTLPQATGAFGSGWFVWVENRGAGTVTITPTTSTIDGAATLTLPTNKGCLIASDGTNYYTMRGRGVAADEQNTFTKAQTVAPTRNTSATGTVTPDFSATNSFMYTLTGNLTIANGTSPTDGQVITFKLKQDGTGSRTLTLGSKYKVAGGAPTLSTAAASLDILSFIYDGTDDVYVGSFGKGAA